jgi:8-oxo-dGTP pyrophosphatase MutT (NUDIX family)
VTFHEVVSRLEAALLKPLPGAAAHALMAPRPRRNWPPGFSIDRVRHAAGLILVFPIDEHPHMVLTVRAHTLDRHSGQVSFPGGVIEPGETCEEAAFREAREEVGLSPDGVRGLGVLSPIDIPVSGFRLHPVVAVTGAQPEFEPAHGEVAQIVEPEIDELMNPAHIGWRATTLATGTLEFPAFVVGGVEIWGATAMVLAEFLSILGWSGPNPTRS